MNDPTTQILPEGKLPFDADQFVRESPVWRRMQYDAIAASLRRVANEQGYEIVAIEHINSSVVAVTAYVGNGDEKRTSLRCRSMVCGLLRSAGVRVQRSKVFARYRRSVIRSVFVPDWD